MLESKLMELVKIHTDDNGTDMMKNGRSTRRRIAGVEDLDHLDCC